MRKISLVLAGAALFASAVANAQTTVVDTIGTNASNTWSTNSTDSNTRFIGADPGVVGGLRPKTGLTAGYVVIPITIGSSSAYGGNAQLSLSSLDIVAQVLSPLGTKTTSSLNSFYGAFYDASGNTLAGANAATSFFSFNTTPLQNTNNPAIGSNQNQIISGNVSGLTLNTGSAYYLVLAPKAGLGSTNADEPTLLTLGAAANRTTQQVTNAGGSLSSTFGTVGQGRFSQNGGSGALTNAQTTSLAPQYFGVKLTANAIPETSTVVMFAMGAFPMGLLLRRRRATN